MYADLYYLGGAFIWIAILCRCTNFEDNVTPSLRPVDNEVPTQGMRKQGCLYEDGCANSIPARPFL